MQVLGNIIGLALLVLGALWIVQSVGLVPGNFLYHEFDWGPRGPVAVASGLVLLFIINYGGPRRR